LSKDLKTSPKLPSKTVPLLRDVDAAVRFVELFKKVVKETKSTS
jgi:hypothetical protein